MSFKRNGSIRWWKDRGSKGGNIKEKRKRKSCSWEVSEGMYVSGEGVDGGGDVKVGKKGCEGWLEYHIGKRKGGVLVEEVPVYVSEERAKR